MHQLFGPRNESTAGILLAAGIALCVACSGCVPDAVRFTAPAPIIPPGAVSVKLVMEPGAIDIDMDVPVDAPITAPQVPTGALNRLGTYMGLGIGLGALMLALPSPVQALWQKYRRRSESPGIPAGGDGRPC